MKPQLNLYPTLLNNFRAYQNETTYGERLAYDEQGMIDCINRKPFEISDAIKKGVALENWLCDKSPMNEYETEFSPEVLKFMDEYCKGSVWQHRVEYFIDLPEVLIRVYGNIDCIKMSKTIDVKSTSRYDFPKFLDSFQHKVYLLGCNDSGIKVNAHTYLITTGKEYFIEEYGYDKLKFIADLTTVSRDLMHFIGTRRDQITDEKLFARISEAA